MWILRQSICDRNKSGDKWTVHVEALFLRTAFLPYLLVPCFTGVRHFTGRNISPVGSRSGRVWKLRLGASLWPPSDGAQPICLALSWNNTHETHSFYLQNTPVSLHSLVLLVDWVTVITAPTSPGPHHVTLFPTHPSLVSPLTFYWNWGINSHKDKTKTRQKLRVKRKMLLILSGSSWLSVLWGSLGALSFSECDVHRTAEASEWK